MSNHITNSKEKKILLKNTVMMYVLQLSSYVFPILTFPYLARVLGVEYYGVIVLVNATMAYFQILIDFGFLLSGTLKCSVHRDDIEKLNQITSSILQAKFIIALIGAFLLIILTYSIDTLSGNKLFIILSYIPVFLGLLLPDFVFRGIEKMSIITYRSLISNIIYLGLIFLLVKKATDFIYIPIINTVCISTTILLSWKYLIKNLGIKFRFVSFENVFYALKDSKTYFFSRIATTMFSSCNVFLLGIFGYKNSQIGNFGAANNLNVMIKSLFTPIVDSIYPYMVRNKDFKLVKKIIFYSFPLILILAISLYFLSNFIITLLAGKQFVGAISSFQLMIPLIVIALPSYILGFPVLGALGKSSIANNSVIIPAITHVVLFIVFYLTGILSIDLVIILTIFTEVFILMIRLYFVYKYIGGKKGENEYSI